MYWLVLVSLCYITNLLTLQCLQPPAFHLAPYLLVCRARLGISSCLCWARLCVCISLPGWPGAGWTRIASPGLGCLVLSGPSSSSGPMEACHRLYWVGCQTGNCEVFWRLWLDIGIIPLLPPSLISLFKMKNFILR